MSIVLAIEPDRRQAAHLTAIARQLVDTELLLADTTEGALDKIGNRVPDLVLVPALLSPQDDAALAAALRVIAAAAHVRTLTIPVLASGIKRAEAGGILAKWRKNRAASSEPEGCDPAVFGEQISAYLKEAAAERARLAADELLNEEPIQAAPPIQSIDSDGGPEIPAPNPSFDAGVAAAPVGQPWNDAAEPTQSWATAVEPTQSWAAAVEPTQSWAAAAEPAPWSAVAAEPLHLLAANPIEEPNIQPDEDPLIDLSEELEGLAEDASRETLDGEPVEVYTIAAHADVPEFDPFETLPEIPEPPETEEEVSAALDLIAASADVAAMEPRESFFAESLPVKPAVAALRAVEPPAPPRADIEPWVPMYLTPGRIWPVLEGVPAETPAARTEQPDWIELVASLRQDLERRRTDPPPAVDPIATRPSDGADAGAHRIVKKERERPKKTKPVQDEWGFFDPERCGFSTLLAKLEEITEEVPGV